MTKVFSKKLQSVSKVNFQHKHKGDQQKEDNEDEYNYSNNNSAKHLGYFTRVKQSVCITIPIDEPIYDASYYRQCSQAIANASEDDMIEFDINSSGGDTSGLISLLTAMRKTNAETVANINGDCHSAASMLAMHCNSVYISPFSSMMVHFVSYGVYGKATDIKSQVIHTHKTNEQFFRDTYRLFLTEVEIEKCINGFELWLDADQIAERMQVKYEQLQKEHDEIQQQQQNDRVNNTLPLPEDTDKPTKKSKAKTTD
jgi:ATP-dependent protease ClpP protease subunit